MNTIAIWFEKKDREDRSQEPEVDLHFNFWKLRLKLKKYEEFFCAPQYDNKYGYFLDIGLKVRKIDLVSAILINVPFKINPGDIKDLGKRLHSNGLLINAIFNEDFELKIKAQSKILEVTNIENKESFSIYALDEKNDLEIIENRYKDDGTIIKINTHDITPSNAKKEVYFRIRLETPLIKNFRYIYQPRNSFFQSAFSNTEVVDFRVNEKRNINPSLLEDIEKEGPFTISKIHFLLLRSARDSYVFSHKPVDSCRGLEKNLWGEYIGNGHKNVDNIIAYHWKEKGKGIISFNSLVKMRFDKNNIFTIAIYILIIIALNVTANYLTAYLRNRFKPKAAKFLKVEEVKKISDDYKK